MTKISDERLPYALSLKLVLAAHIKAYESELTAEDMAEVMVHFAGDLIASAARSSELALKELSDRMCAELKERSTYSHGVFVKIGLV